MFCRHLEKFQTKETLKFHLEINFNNLENKKKEKTTIACYNIFTVGINVIEFHVNIISDLCFTTILYLFLLHTLLKGEY